MKKMYINLRGRCSSLLMFFIVMSLSIAVSAQEIQLVAPGTTGNNFSVANECSSIDPSFPEGITPAFTPGNPPLCPGGFKLDPPMSGTFQLNGGTITIDISLTSCGQVFSWSVSPGIEIHEIIVKGGPNANTYDYSGLMIPPMQDGNLHAPLNPNGMYAGLSHMNFCYTYVPPLECSVMIDHHVTCYGGNDGQATVTAVNGTPPYSYLWSDGQTTQTATNLAAGYYSVVVTDVNGKTTECSATIEQPEFKPIYVNAEDQMAGPCISAEDLDMAFHNWIQSITVTGGTPPLTITYMVNGMVVENLSGLTAPDACGGSVIVEVDVIDACEVTAEGSASFAVAEAPPMVFTLIENIQAEACLSQAEVDAAYAAWHEALSFSGGCGLNPVITIPPAPDFCGGSATVNWNVSSDCEDPIIGSATFFLPDAPDVELITPSNLTTDACMDQTDIDAAFALWLAEASVTGGCNAMLSINPLNPVAPDACGGEITVTWTVTSACEEDVVNSATFTVPYDDEAPVIAEFNDIMLEGCNTPWPDAPTTTWTDNCSDGGTITGVAGEVMTDGCYQYIDYAFNVTDDCGNDAEEVIVRVTRMYDETPPVIAELDDIMLEGCNTPWPDAPTTTWTDNCSDGGTITGVAGEVMTDGCYQTLVYTFNVTDDCGNEAEEVYVTVNRMYDVTAPEIAELDDIMLEGCNTQWPDAPTTTWTDNCSEGGTITGVAGEVMTDGCYQYIDYAFNVTDDCGNAAEEVVVRVTRMYDVTAPVIAELDDIMLEGCNTPWPDAPTTTWTDNCSDGGTITGIAGEVMTDGC